MTNNLETLRNRFNKLTHIPPIVHSHGWLYGVWYCGTGFQKAVYHGQYPMTFVKRVRTMFPVTENKMLHLCCGKCHIEGAVNVDSQPLPEADIVADAENLAPNLFLSDDFDVCLIDPPYTEEDATRYGNSRLISPKKVFEQLHRVIKPEGWVLWLDEKYPQFPKKDWDLQGLIAVVKGANRRTCVLSMFQKRAVPLTRPVVSASE